MAITVEDVFFEGLSGVLFEMHDLRFDVLIPVFGQEASAELFEKGVEVETIEAIYVRDVPIADKLVGDRHERFEDFVLVRDVSVAEVLQASMFPSVDDRGRDPAFSDRGRGFGDDRNGGFASVCCHVESELVRIGGRSGCE